MLSLLQARPALIFGILHVTGYQLQSKICLFRFTEYSKIAYNFVCQSTAE